MPKEKYRVELSEEEIQILREITKTGNKNSANTIMHANVLLNTNDTNPTKRTDRELSEIFGISKTTVNAIRQTYSIYGMETALNRKTRITAPHISKITGDFEAQVIATALSPAPAGRSKWKMCWVYIKDHIIPEYL